MDSIPIICKLFQPATNGDWKHWSASQKPGLWQNWSGVDPAIFMSIWRSNGFWWFSAHITPRNVSSNAPHIAPDSPSSSEAEGREVSCGAEFNHQQGMDMTCECKKSCNSWEIMRWIMTKNDYLLGFCATTLNGDSDFDSESTVWMSLMWIKRNTMSTVWKPEPLMLASSIPQDCWMAWYCFIFW